MLKKFFAIILLLSLLLLTVGCNQQSNQKPTESSSDTSSDATEENPDDIEGTLLSGENRYKIIFPDGKKSLAIKIQDKLTALDPATLGTIGYYSTQLDTKAEDNGAPEILIGKTNRTASKDAEAALPSYLDYSITVKDNKITIFAHTDERLEEAVTKFTSLLKCISKKHVVYTGNSSHIDSYKGYLYSDLKLGADSVKDYKIVVSASATDVDKQFASSLQNWIACSTGLLIPIAPDSDAPSEKEILIGNTARELSEESKNAISEATENTFFAKLDGKRFIIAAEKEFGYKKALISIKNNLASNGGTLSADANLGASVSIDGSNAIFIGNSFVFFGNCVIGGDAQKTDLGYFHQICKANGDNVTVHDYTWGGKDLNWIYTNYLTNCTDEFKNKIDYVFISEAGQNSSNFVDIVTKIGNLFPNAKAKVYLNHSFACYTNATYILDGMETLKENGYLLVDWGRLVCDIWEKKVEVPNATLEYDKSSFIVNKTDNFHENMLTGYITAQMCYCVVTGVSALGQDYSFCTDPSVHPSFDVDSHKNNYYNQNSTNFDLIFKSPADMQGLQDLMDIYLATSNG